MQPYYPTVNDHWQCQLSAKQLFYFLLSVYTKQSSTCGSAKPGVIAEWEFGKNFRWIKGKRKRDMSVQNLASDKRRLEFIFC